jgi:hypothetical protein
VILSCAIARAAWRYANSGWVGGVPSFSTCYWVMFWLGFADTIQCESQRLASGPIF